MVLTAGGRTHGIEYHRRIVEAVKAHDPDLARTIMTEHLRSVADDLGRWQARLEGSDDSTLVDLLAIRLSWECLLDDGMRQETSVWARWQANWRRHFQDDRVRGLLSQQ